jgi:IS605 OrfB family transposase
MFLTQQTTIKSSNSLYREIDQLCFLSKNLYNVGNYIIRNEFINNGKWIRYHQLANDLKNNVDFQALPSKVSQLVLMNLDRNWKSFFRAIKEWKKCPDKFKGKPSLPKYKHKTKGRNILIYNNQAFSKKELKKGLIVPSKTNLKIPCDKQNVMEVRIIPKNKQYVIEIVYEKEVKPKNKCNRNFLSIDLGVNNLCAITSNRAGFNPRLINGKTLKSINQFYNKKKSKYQSELPKNVYTSDKIIRLTNKRNDKIKHHLHNISKYIVNMAIENEINTIVCGHNKQWKNDINIGKRNNQTFTNIPHSKLIDMLKYKCELNGIIFVQVDEAYTSKCSLIDMETIKKHDTYVGKRIKRGLFQTKKNKKINADINGSGNILRKAFGNDVFTSNSIEGFVVSPRKVTFSEHIFQ